MTVTQTVTYELYMNNPLVDNDGNILTDNLGNILTAPQWVDVSADVLASPAATWTRGNSGRTVFDRVANIGSLSFALNNSITNREQTAGLYSPDHGNVNGNFGLDTAVRVTVTEGVTAHPEWQGTITRLRPVSGQYGPRVTEVTAEDWMANAYRDTVRGITVQTNKRDDELLTTLLTLASTQPLATDFSTGDDTYTYALHDENSMISTLARVFQKIAMSGFGRIYLTGYSTHVYRTRSTLLTSGTPSASLSDTMTGLIVSRSKAQRVKEVNVTTYPVEVDTSAAILWESQRERELAAGESVEFDIHFRDPSGRATRVAATSLTTPVADTDYKLSSVSGSGNDMNASLSITVTLKADLATVSLTNTHGSQTGYLWFHQQRGLGVYLYEPITTHDVTGQPDGETIDVDMVYQDDPNVGDDIRSLLTYWHVVDQSDVESVTFIANIDQDRMDAAMLASGELVTITETQTGINSNFIINGTSKTHLPGNLLQVTWYLTYANQLTGVCFLDVVGTAELDSTAFLGA